tara:strand:- start:1373 stop:1567 length:195 start_codon:yes stop_codon:yes gene_type:complete
MLEMASSQNIQNAVTDRAPYGHRQRYSKHLTELKMLCSTRVEYNKDPLMALLQEHSNQTSFISV